MILKQIAEVKFPTRWAIFRLLAFEAFHAGRKTPNKRQETALTLVLGDLHSYPPLVRIHSQCTTGEAFHSLRCDCHDQLQMALSAIAEEGAGVLVYEQQEGRGIGLMEKLRAYELQDQGLDTVDANLRLGHAVDLRDYALAVQILHFLRIQSLRLISNNPDKIRAVTDSGIRLVERVTADVPSNRHSRHYIATKREKLGHFSSPEVESFVAADGAVPGPLLADEYRETTSPRGEAGTETRGGSWPMS
ncbi:GTP cyclohydrolase-2 [Candidatus Sulfotelmatomonas gaucii]|uniref:GTP cyclohydrolase-2 n=1 Tax=Candidatus Sulfuritelmatomonas gaucii TaxID=2043161 RepID=A0A2N9LX71_9BACT|nr:GTP cyclohydrolase-2 [Candidatus Sulfotelmatomonas gaucii]